MKTGDVVRLKSGGPPMTVAESVQGNCMCQWVDATNRLCEESFHESMLAPVKDQLMIPTPHGIEMVDVD